MAEAAPAPVDSTTEQQSGSEELETIGVDKRVIAFTAAHTSSCKDPELVDCAARLIQFILSITASNKRELLEKISAMHMDVVRAHIRSGLDGMTLEELCSVAAPITKHKRPRPAKTEDGTRPAKRSKKNQKEEDGSSKTGEDSVRVGEDGLAICR